MKRKGLAPIALTVLSIAALAGCGSVNLTDAALNATKLIDFKDGANPEVLFESDGWSNGDVFNVVWKKDNVHYEDGIMRLGITEEKATATLDDELVEYNYTAGEARTQNYYGFGDYEVSMKPSKNGGTASTFFTCTGPYDTKFVLDDNGDYVLDDNGQRVSVNNPHDEIDIEFLGKDTTHVQFNYFVNGVGGHEYMHDLGFDASEEFHEYGYRWAEDSITWFIDDKPVYKVTTDKSVKTGKNVVRVDELPKTPGRILTNYWCGNERAEGWMGKYTGNTHDDGTEYQWMATSAIGAPLNPVEQPDVGVDEIDWNSIDAITPTFESTDEYTVTNTGTSSNITYSNVGGSQYVPVEMDITQAASGNNYVHLKAKNNGTEMVQARVNVIDSELVAAGAQNMSTNVSATMNGQPVNTDLEWGGSFFELQAGQEADLVIKYNGIVEKLQLMLDSSRNNANTYSGDVTVSEIKFAKLGEIEIPDTPKPDTPNPDTPNPDVTLPEPSEGVGLTFTSEPNTGYTITSSTDNTTVNVKYEGLGTGWKPVAAAVADLARGNDTFSVTIKNNGTADSRVRFDVQGTTSVSTGDGSQTDATNVSAVGGDVWTDTTWGGSTLTVSPGQEIDLVITYNGNGPQGAVRNILVYVDTARGDNNTYNSDITLSKMNFTNVNGTQGGEDVGGEETTSQKLSFATGTYTINPANEVTDTLDVSYENVTGGTYANVCANIVEIANGNNRFEMTIKNNGEATVRVRTDIKATNTVANTNVCNTSSSGGGSWTDLEWGGSFVDVAPGATVDLVVNYDANEAFGPATELLVYFDTSTYGDTNTYSGNLTLNNFKFSNVA